MEYTQHQEFIETKLCVKIELGKVEQIPADVYSYKVMDYINSAPYCKQVDYRYKTLYIVASQENLDKEAQKHIYTTIHASKYGQNGYVWVNEVVNYEGGDNYAIRRIHPVLQTGEGQYLSTNVKDVKGNIHCSIGYATVIEGDTFETLFSRADKALYHVKKNGKNNFASYSPEMEKEG